MRKVWKRVRTLFPLLCAALTLLCPQASATESPGEADASEGERVIIALDASKSLPGYTDRGTGEWVKGADPDGLRFDAIEWFLEEYLPEMEEKRSSVEYEVGYVIFSNDVDKFGEPRKASATDAELTRKNFVDSSGQAVGRQTNIGAALSKAVELAQKGNPDYHAAVVLFSDGKTDMGSSRDPETPKRLEESRALEDAARAEAKEKNIPILSCFLNVDGIGGAEGRREMQSLASEPQYFVEIDSPDHLKDQLSALFTKAIGVESVYIPDPADSKGPLIFNSDGALDVPFPVPGFGLSSVQITLVDKSFDDLKDIRLEGPGNITKSRDELLKPGDTLIDVPIDPPGTWILHMVGEQGDSVRLRLLYDADLQVNAEIPETAPDGGPLDPAQPLNVSAVLEADGVAANSAAQYWGFEAELVAQDEIGAEISRTPMALSADGTRFEASYQPPKEGTYHFAVRASAPSEVKVRQDAGEERTFPIEPCDLPLVWVARTFSASAVDNPPRVPLSAVIVKVAKGDNVSVDLSDYVEDEDKDALTYTILSVPENTNYLTETLPDSMLYAPNFNLTEGEFLIGVTDKAEQDAEFTVRVTSEEAPNTPPEVKSDPIEVTINRGAALNLDLSEYVSDKEDSWANMECDVKALSGVADFEAPTKANPILRVGRFDAKEGSFGVTVTDSAGASCNFIISVRTTNPYALLIVILLLLLLLLIAFLIGQLNRKYHGTIEITTEIGGATSPRPYTFSPIKGACPLSRFDIPNLEENFGLIPGQCAFHPAGDASVTLTTNRPVRASIPGVPETGTRKLTFPSGHKISVIAPDHPGNRLVIQFKSKTNPVSLKKP